MWRQWAQRRKMTRTSLSSTAFQKPKYVALSIVLLSNYHILASCFLFRMNLRLEVTFPVHSAWRPQSYYLQYVHWDEVSFLLSGTGWLGGSDWLFIAEVMIRAFITALLINIESDWRVSSWYCDILQVDSVDIGKWSFSRKNKKGYGQDKGYFEVSLR